MVASWPLTGVRRTGGYEAPLVVGFLLTGLVRHGESILPTLGWCQSVMEAGDGVPSSSSFDYGTSGDEESTQGGGGLR
jgi:hypothetical protein